MSMRRPNGNGERAKRLQSLTQTGPDTLMGKLLRRFWHPVAVAERLAPGTAQSLRIMCEDLTLYRGESGKAYLVGGRCAHRCTVLHTGWVKDDQIRCMYHGWRYDGEGRCTEMPAEKNAKLDLVRIASYPLHEYCGLIFAYMGEGQAPPFDLPRKDVLELPGCGVAPREEIWDCHWLQQAENSLDSTHLSFAHQWPQPSRLGEEIGDAIPELTYEETAGGIRQTATRTGGQPRISNWTFPNNNHVLSAPPRKGDPWINTIAWAVPIDDERTLRFSLYVHPGGETGADLLRAGLVANVQATEHAGDIFERHRLPQEAVGAVALVLQDYAAVRGQGVVHDRSEERLGASDAGVALLRRILFRELDAVRGGTPTKQWTRIASPASMLEAVRSGGNRKD
jgi:5,5'-dehydrodivanillate O-demethylase oxygenase subunit